MQNTRIDKINSLRIETDEELGGDGYARIYNMEDGSAQNVFCLRVDFKWVSIADAVEAVENTFLMDLIYDKVGDEGVVSDILVTRSIETSEVSFAVLADSKEISIKAGERFRP